MKNHVMKLTALVLVMILTISVLAGCGKTEEASAEELYFTQQEVRKSPEWVTKLDATKDADQLIVVAGVDKTTAYITMHEKNADGVSQQTKFDQYIVGYQVPVECYSLYLTQSNGLKGDDLDGDGKTDSGSLAKKKLAVIDRLPLQPGQKTALALFATGNAESTIRKYAPWL